MFFDEVDAKNNWFIQIFDDEKVVCQDMTFYIDLDIKLAVHLQLMTSCSSELFPTRDRKCSRSLGRGNFLKNF